MIGPPGDELRDEAFARPEIRYRDGGNEVKQEVTDGLPGPSRTVITPQPAGDEIEVFLGHLAPAADQALEHLLIALHLRLGGHETSGRIDQRPFRRKEVGVDRVERILSLPSVDHEIGLPEERQLGGNP